MLRTRPFFIAVAVMLMGVCLAQADTPRRLTLNEAIAAAIDGHLKQSGQSTVPQEDLNDLIANTEAAYWKLYEAYGQACTHEEIVRLVSRALDRVGSPASGSALPLRAKYNEARGSRVSAMNAVADAEHNLRGVIGMALKDGTRLLPVTAPALPAERPEWSASLKLALARTEDKHSEKAERITRRLIQHYQQLSEWQARFEAAVAACRAYQDSLDTYFSITKDQDVHQITALILCNELSAAMQKRSAALAGYNRSLAQLEYVKGTLPSYRRLAVAQATGNGSLAPAAHMLEVLANIFCPSPLDPILRPAEFLEARRQGEESSEK